MDKPVVAISRCLLGERVRYDAELKHFPELVEFVRARFTLIEICPEVEIGLSTPRPPVRLVQQEDQLQILGRDDPTLDITAAMQTYCEHRATQLDSIHGYIFKCRSPSCGVTDTPIFNEHGEILHYASGMFAQRMLQQYPQLPITDEESLITAKQRDDFAQQVKRYQQKLST